MALVFLALLIPCLGLTDEASSDSAAGQGGAIRDEFDINPRGGSFSLVPAFLLPASPLDRTLHPALGYNLDFDIGFSQGWSVIFGAGYNDLIGRQNPDYHLMLAPAWFGFKSKEQFLPAAEVYWEAAAVLFYEKGYFLNSSVGAQENLDGGAMIGAGLDIWWARWLLTGFQARILGVAEDGQLFPFMQLGLRAGVRG